MGSIFEDRSKRKRRHRSNRKHYVGFSDLFGPHRRKFVKTRRQAVIALFIILTIGILVIISSFSDDPSEHSTLIGTYNVTENPLYISNLFFSSPLNSDEPVSLTFTEDTLTIDSPLRDQLTVFQYELANCRYYNGSPTPCFQLYSNGQESFTIPYTIHGYCMSFWLSTSQSSTACKSDSDNESTIIVSNYLYLYTGIILVVLGLLPILLLVFRSRIFRRRKRLIDSPKIRVSIPSATRQQVYARARGRCERPRCSYHGKLHIHHIDENPSNNSPTNLVAVCPNCHTRIHDGEFSIDAQRSWIAS